MKKELKSIILSGLIGINALVCGVNAENSITKPALTISRVQNVDAKPVNRAELVGKLLPDLDYYGVAQEQNGNEFFKLRSQLVPLKYNSFSLGSAVQVVDTDKCAPDYDLGIVGRFQRKFNSGFGKMDLRYFPDEKTIDEYCFLDTKKLFIDCLGAYNYGKHTGFLQPGIDYKVGKHIWVGAETKFAGDFSNLKNQYYGLRAKLQF